MKITQAPVTPPSPAPFRFISILLETQEEYDAFCALANNSALCEAVPPIKGWWFRCQELMLPVDSHKYHGAIEKMRGAPYLKGELSTSRDPDTLAPGHNPLRLTCRDVGMADGWRLLEIDEIGDRLRKYIPGLERRRPPEYPHWDGFGWGGSDTSSCYRTKLTREALAEARRK